jgi:hypothetical protein
MLVIHTAISKQKKAAMTSTMSILLSNISVTSLIVAFVLLPSTAAELFETSHDEKNVDYTIHPGLLNFVLLSSTAAELFETKNDEKNVDYTFHPGLLNVQQDRLLLSEGLLARVIADVGKPVKFHDGGESKIGFHNNPDGAAVFSRKGTDGWVYVSNSEDSKDGGVGAIYFNSQGQVVDYQMILEGTKSNCGGGKTWWNTWISCEEHDKGQVWEVDPWGTFSHLTAVGLESVNYESFAYDHRKELTPTFYVTIDEVDGPLLRYTPDTDDIFPALLSSDFSNLLTSPGPNAKWEYLVLDYDTDTSGTLTWTTDIKKGRDSAGSHFRGLEGLDVYDGMLYMTAKEDRLLFILDLDAETFTQSSTLNGAFDNRPDQVVRLVDNNDEGILYFCEDGKFGSGVHGRDVNGNYFTIITADQDPATNGGEEMRGEVSGLAFTEDKMFMYFTFQKEGTLFEVRRADGLPFNGKRLDIKYHHVDEE